MFSDSIDIIQQYLQVVIEALELIDTNTADDIPTKALRVFNIAVSAARDECSRVCAQFPENEPAIQPYLFTLLKVEHMVYPRCGAA